MRRTDSPARQPRPAAPRARSLLTAIALLVGTVLVVQLPLFDVFDALPRSTLLGAILLAILAILTIGLTAGLYPSWLTTRIQPAEALHHD